MHLFLRRLGSVFFLVLFAVAVWNPRGAEAVVQGQRPTALRTFKVFGNAAVTGNTLMSASPPGNVNDILLPQNSASISGIPFDGQLVAAYLWWTGSTAATGVDRQVDFTTASGSKSSVTADTCQTMPAIYGKYGFFYCRKDVTSLIKTNGGGLLNGTYVVGDVQALTGQCPPQGNDQFCQARYAAWSLIVVWESPTHSVRRDIVMYDGFLHMDEDQTSGITTFQLSGFTVGNPPQGSFTYFGLEGDSFLGSPPEPSNYADFISFRSNTATQATRLSSSTPYNPPGNIWNSTIALGVDIDTFDIGQSGLGLINPGDTSATIVAGTGDGIVPGGNGESVFLGYILLSIDTLSPNFRNARTTKRVSAVTASIGDSLTYTLRVTNTGSLEAKNTIVTDAIPANTTYIPNSTRVDGQLVPDVNGTSPLVTGLNLGTIDFRTNNEREITFQVRITGLPANRRIENSFVVKSDEVGPTTSNVVVTTISAPQLGTLTKTVVNQSTPGGPVRPGDRLRYTIEFTNTSGIPAGGIQFVDDMPKFVKLLSVAAGSGTATSSTTGGANGTGQVTVTNVSVPGNGTTRIFIDVQVFSESEFVTAGIAVNQIDGQLISNQGEARVPQLSFVAKTDDPATAAKDDPTVVRVSYRADFTGSAKTVRDDNGGIVEPGDLLTYTITLTNKGTRNATVRWTDDLPPAVGNYKQVSIPTGSTAQFQVAPAGGNQTGLLTVSGIKLDVGQTATIVFTVNINANATNGQQITNVGTVFDEQDANNKLTLSSPTLVVVAGPLLDTSTKAVTDAQGQPVTIVTPGSTLRYTITVTNTGNRPATNVVVTDQVSGELEQIQVAQGGQLAGNTITWNATTTATLASIAANSSVTLSFTARVKLTTADGTLISNQGIMQTPGLPNPVPTDDPTTRPRGDATVVRVSAKPQLTMTKTVVDNNGGDPEPGDTLTYTITLRNTGTGAATDVEISDPIDASLSNVQPTNGRLTAGAIVWDKTTLPTLASLAIGAQVQLTFTAQIRSPLANGTTISNQASVRAANVTTPVLSDDPGTTQPNDPTVITVKSSANPIITKRVQDQNGGDVVPGDTLVYTITIEGRGNAPLVNVVVTDAVPTELTNISPGLGGQLAGNIITWNASTTPALAQIAPGQQVQLTFTAQVTANLADGTVVSNQGQVRATGFGPQPTDDPTTPTANDPTRVTVRSRPDLTTSTKVVSDVNGGVTLPGDVLSYTITLRNTGNVAASNVVVTDPVDTNLTNVTPGNGGTFANGQITWQVPSLAAGATVTLTFTATIRSPLTNGTVIRNQATISGGNFQTTVTDDPSTPTNDDSTNITVTSGPAFAETTKTVQDLNGGSLAPGDTVRYTIVVRNTGTDVANNVIVTDAVDTTKLNQIRPGQNGTITGNTITWNATTTPSLASIPINGSVTLTFDATVIATVANGTVIENQAFVRSQTVTTPVPSDDPRTVDLDDSTKITVVAGAALTESTKEVRDNNGGSVQPGDVLTYTLVIRNTGTGVANNVVVADPVNTNQLTNIQPTRGRFSGGVIVWDRASEPQLAAIAPNQSVTLTFTATVAPGLLSGTRIANQATITATDVTTPVPTDDPSTPALDDPTVVVVGGQSQLTATKTVQDTNGGSPEPGDNLVYTIVVNNRGTAPATNVVVTDVIDQNLDQIAVAPGSNGSYDAANRRITWLVGNIPANGSVTLSFSAQIQQNILNGTRIANQAVVSSPDLPQPILSDNPNTPAANDSTDLVVNSPLRVVFEKTAIDINGGAWRPGDIVEYSIKIINNGRSTLTNAVISDRISANLDQIQPQNGGVFAAGEIRWNVGNIAANGSLAVVFRARIVPTTTNGTLIPNQALLTAQGLPASLPSDDPATAQPNDPTVIEVAFPDLSGLTKEARDLNGGSYEPGDSVEYKITVRNTGRSALTQIVVSDVVDPTWLEQIQPGQGGRLAGNTVTWDSTSTPALARVAPNSTVELFFTARIKANTPDGTNIDNQASARAAEVTTPELSDDPATPQVDDVTRINVRRAPNLSQVTKTVVDNNGGTVRPGDTLTYTIVVQNTGSRAATQVVVTDRIDPRLTNIQLVPPGSGTFSNGQITWSAATLPQLAALQPNTSVTLSFTAVVDTQTPDGTVVANQAEVRSPDLLQPELSDDPRTPAPKDSTNVTVRAAADLANGVKTVQDLNGGTVQPGDILEYTITIRNQGNTNALQSRLTDSTPQNTDFVTGSLRLNGVVIPDGGTNPLNAGILIRSARAGTQAGVVIPDDGAAPNDEAAVVVFQVRVRPGTPNGTIIRNQGIVTIQGGTQPWPTNEATVVVGGGPNLTNTAKTVRISNDQQVPGQADIGDELEYTVTIRNTGQSAANNVVFTDPIPVNAEYVANSVVLNNQPQTDVADGDATTFQANLGPSGTISVNVGTMNPNATVSIRFRVRIRVTAAIQVSNQGIVQADNFPRELTDADDNDSNGNQPTVIPVGRRELLTATKAVVDVNGGNVNPGDTLEYRITLLNSGLTPLANIQVSDVMPANTTYVANSAQGPGTNNYDAGTRTLTFQGISLNAGDSVLLLFRVQIANGLANGTKIANKASVSAPPVIQPFDTNVVEVEVQQGGNLATLSGRVFQDYGADDTNYDSGEDEILPGFKVKLSDPADPNNVLAEATVDNQGQYKIENLRSTRYLVRVYSERDVQFGQQELDLTQGGTFTRNLLVEPTGRVYNSQNGSLLADARVFLVYDDLTNTPCSDDNVCGVNAVCVREKSADAQGRCGEKVPDNQLLQNQQGQATNPKGMYKFTAPVSNRGYRLVVRPAEEASIFPSQSLVAQTGVAQYSSFSDGGKIVADDLPAPQNPQKPTTYFLRFAVSQAAQVIQNNHVPVDLAGSLLVLTKSASTRAATVGDIITYTLELRNGSAKEFKYDVTRKVGGIFLTDILPPGFRLMALSPRVFRSDGKIVLAQVDAGAKNGQLNTELPQRIFRFGPFDLPGRSTLILKYQVVVGRQLKVGEYINVAYAHNEAGGSLTEYARAMVRIVYDPIFDQGTVIGKVFCDNNKNRWQDKGDVGIPGVRIYLDTGFYVTTDSDGKYHLQAIDPGNHMIKIDAQTLPPGAKMIDTPDQIFYISRGLVRKINFAVSCQTQTVGVQKFFLFKRKPKRVRLEIDGDVNGPRLRINGKARPLPVVDMVVTDPTQIPNYDVQDGPDFRLLSGRLSQPLVFSMRVAPGFAPESWQIDIYKKAQDKEMRLLLRTLKGVGNPPPQIGWDGTAPLGQFLLEPRQLYMARMTYQTLDGVISQTPWRVFGIDYTKQLPKVLYQRTLPVDSMGRRGVQVRGTLLRQLRRQRRLFLNLMRQPRTLMEVEVHHDNSLPRTRSLFLTVRRAAAVKRYLERLFRGTNLLIRSKGMGAAQPELPNISARNKRRNRRVVVRILQLPQPGGKRVPALVFQPEVILEAQPLSVDVRGQFKTVLEVKPTEVPRIQIKTPRGAYLNVPLRELKQKPQARKATPRELAQLRRWEQLAQPKKQFFRVARSSFQKVKKTWTGKQKAKISLPNLYPDISPATVLKGREHLMFEFRDASQSTTQKDPLSQPIFRLYVASTGVEHRRGKGVSEREQLKTKALTGAKVAQINKASGTSTVIIPAPVRTTKVATQDKAKSKPEKPEGKLVQVPVSQAGQAMAAQLRVSLPPQGSLLRNAQLLIKGTTHPKNILTIQGKRVPVEKDGTFQTNVSLQHGQKSLTIQTLDTDGNRGEIVWPIHVNLNRFFLMAFADTALAQDSAKQLEGFNDHSSFRVPEAGLIFHGRAVLYTKGYIQGKHFLSSVFKTIEFTAHLDTAKKREMEEFYKQLIDPEKFYPIYGDSSQQVQDVAARDKLYILIKADQSKLLVGNFRTMMEGHELKRYDRTFYGVDIDFRKRFAKHFETRARFFISDGTQQQVKAHVQLRGTAGSLYYLKHRSIIEGSEQVRLTVRDKDSNIILAQIALQRNQDYVIQYFDGRLFFKYPVPSVVDSFILTQHNLNTTLDGNPVFIEVDYEYESVDGQGGLAFGVRAEQGLWDKIHVGFSYVQEGRAGGSDPYTLWGFDATLRWNQNTYLKAEYARSYSFDSQSYLSLDGGLTFNPGQRFYNNPTLDMKLAGRSDNISGNAVALRLGTDIGELFKWKKERFGLEIRSYFTWRERGFFAAGQNLEQGSMKGGVLAHITLFQKHKIQLKYDGATLERFDLITSRNYNYEQHLMNLQYTFNFLPNWDAVVEYSYTNNYDERAQNVDGNQAVLWGNFVTLGVNWRINKLFQVLLRQQLAFATVSREPLTIMDHFATTLGLNLRVFKDTFLSGTMTVRWSGNVGAQIGLKTELNTTSSAYVREQINFAQHGTGLTHTLVVGAENKLTKDTRLYGEYQLDGGMSAESSRAVVGLGHVFHLFKGFYLGTGLEYARFLDPTFGNTSRTVGRITVEYLGLKQLKVSGRYELRYDDADKNSPGLTSGDRIQFVTLNNLTWQITPDLSFMARVNYALTHNTGLNGGLGGAEGELLEFSTGMAYRPVKHDWFHALLKYTMRRELRPLALNDNRAQYSTTEVLSFVPMFELPFRLQIVEQIAVRFRQEHVDGLQPASTATIMWINRLNFHLIKKLDIGVEYRFLWMWQASAGEAFALSTFDHGLLIEAAYNVHQYVHLGVGYNFSSFSDNLFADPNRSYNGFFLRVVGKY